MRYILLVLLMSFLVSVNSGSAQCQVGESQVIIEVDGSAGQYNSEIFWRLFNDDTEVLVSETVDGFLGSGAIERDTLCLQDGVNYRFEAYDTFGDGWNDAVYSLFYSDGFVLHSGMPNSGGESSESVNLEETRFFTAGDRPGDDCSSPKELSVGETVNVSTELYSNSYVLDPLFDSGNEAIFNFTPLISEQYAISFSEIPSIDRGSLQLFDNCYDNNPTRLAFDSTGVGNNFMEIFENLTAGNTYFIVISNNSADTGIDFIEGNLNVSYSGTPTNINCENAFSLTVDGDSIYSRTSNALPSQTPVFSILTQDGVINEAYGDSLFFNFTLSTQEDILIEIGDIDLYNSVYVELEKMENCGEEAESTFRRGAFEDIEKVFAFNNLSSGTYRLKVFPPSSYEDEFFVSVKTQGSQVAAPNQTCENAAELNIYSANQSLGSSSITSIPYFNATDSGIGAPCNQDSIYSVGTGDVWIKAQVPYSRNLIIETFGEYYDVLSSPDQSLETRISVYTGTCGSISEFYCSDKVEAHQKDTISGLPQGEEVFIRLWDKNGDNSGLMNVRLIEPDPLPVPETSVTSFTDSLHVSFTNFSGDVEFFYEVIISEDSFQTSLPGFGPATISSYQGQFGVSNLQPATTYYFQIFSKSDKLTNSDTTVFQVETAPIEINSIANGDWSDPNTWQGGNIPAADSAVNIYHQVSINEGESFDINSVNVIGAFEEQPNAGLWINNGNLNVDKDIRVEHYSGTPTDSVGIFMFTDGVSSANLDVGNNMIFELFELNNGDPIKFIAINNGDSLKVNVGNEFSFRHTNSDSIEQYTENILFQNVDFTVGGYLSFLNDNMNSAQPFNAVFQDSRITTDFFDLNAIEFTEGDFQVNFIGNTEVDINSNFRRPGNGGKIKFSDQSTLSFNGSDYQEITGFGEFQDSIIYNNVVVNVAQDLNNGREIPILKTSSSYNETQTKILILGELNLLNGILTDESDVFSIDRHEVIFGSSASVVGSNPNSYITEPVSKIGNTPFTFPVGSDLGLRKIRISNNEEFQMTDKVTVLSYDNSCGISDSLLTNSSLVRDRTKEFWQLSAELSNTNVAASFEPIINNPLDESITDFSALELIVFNNGSSLGNGSSNDSSFITATELNFSLADTIRLGLSSNLEFENPFYEGKRILDLSTYSAASGESVTINYSASFASAADKVYLGGKQATVLGNTANSITFSVPEGARSGRVELVYDNDKIAYSRQDFTLKYSATNTILSDNYTNLTALDSISGNVLLGQTNMQLGLISNDEIYDAMIVSQDYQPITVVNNLSGTIAKEEFNLLNEGTFINPTDIELGLSNFNGSLALDLILEFEVNGDNGLLYYENDGFGNFSQFGEGEADNETIFNDYIFNDLNISGKTDVLFSIFNVSDATSMMSLSSEGGGNCNSYSTSNLPFIEPNNKNISSILLGDFIDNGSTDIGILVKEESIIGMLDLYSPDTAYYYSNNSRTADQIFEIKNISLLNDGFSQIVASNQSTNEIEVYSFNNGTLSIDITTVPLSFTPAKLDAEDINGDGFQDLIVSDQNTASLHILLNNGSGQLTEDLSVSYGGGIIADFDVMDLNNDGIKDFLILQEGGQLSAAYYQALNLNTPTISASNITTSSFDLAWDSVGYAVEYEIFISLENDTITDLSTDSTFILGDTALSFEAPTPFETYYVFGRSISSEGDTSSFSNPVQVDLLTLDSMNIQSQNITTSTFDLAWDSVGYAVEYEIFISLENDTIMDLSTDSTFILGDTALSFEAPTPFETYYVFGRSISSEGDTSSFSNPVQVDLRTLNSMSIQSQNITTSTFDLGWSTVENAAEYEVFISLENDTIADLATDSTLIVGDTALSFGAPSPFETYYIFGRSISSVGDTSNFSSPITVNLLTLDSLNFQAQNISNSGFDLSWNAVTNAGSYEVVISLQDSPNAGLESDSVFQLSDTTITFNAPIDFEEYFVYGRAISTQGDTAEFGNSYVVQLENIQVPEPVTANLNSNGFDLSWTAIPGADQYAVYIGTNADTASLGENDSLFVVSNVSTNYQVPEYSELYYFFVKAISNYGDTSAFSLEDSVKLPVSVYLEQDSLAMVSLYETNGGENWPNNQNWLTGKLNTWEGLEMNADTLFAINLPSNQLEGVLPNDLDGLNFINAIDFSGNNLTDVSSIINQVNSLNSLNLSGNALNFEQLEAFSSIPNFIYNNQDFEYGLPTEIFESLGTDISITVEANAIENTFQWYKDSAQIAGATNPTLSLTNAQRSDEGLYYVEIKNALLPNLTLISNLTVVKMSSLERDVVALRQFYDSTNGDSWNTIIWDTTSDNPTEWSADNQDIIVEDNRVVEINLPDNNLTGSIPDALNEVLGLRSINLANNAIEDLADLTALPNLTQLDLSGNALGFDDLERNISVEGFGFSNQANFGNESNQKIPQGSSFTLTYEVEGSANVYNWYRNDELIENADTSEFTIDSITFENMGEYRLEVGNAIVNAVNQEFKLSSNSVNIIASSTISGNVQDANEFATESGQVYLFKELSDGSYDSVRFENGDFFQNIQGDGSFELQNIELGDYLIYINNDENNYANLLNTYYPNTIDWELAEIVNLRSDINELLITMEGEPQELSGTSVLAGYLEEEYNEGERKLPRRRVSGVGVSVRTLVGSSRDISFRSILENNELVAYLETDENGEFQIPNLTAGRYSIKFDIPGVPMNEQSDITFDLTGEDQEALEIAAVSDNGQISVSKVSYTANKSELLKKVTVYPNPSNAKFNINGTESISNIKIISSEGRLIKELSELNNSSQEVEIDLSDYPDGMYFMQIVWKDGLRSMNKLIKK